MNPENLPGKEVTAFRHAAPGEKEIKKRRYKDFFLSSFPLYTSIPGNSRVRFPGMTVSLLPFFPVEHERKEWPGGRGFPLLSSC